MIDGLGKIAGGACNGVVADNEDPEGIGRVLVRFPWADDELEAWARIACPAAGDDEGTWFPPAVGDEVLIVFLGGDPSAPCVIGSMWNGANRPPTTDVGKKVVQGRNGTRIEIHEDGAQGRIRLETPDGTRIELAADDRGSVSIEDGVGNTIETDADGVRVVTPKTLTLDASTLELKASRVNIDAPTVAVQGGTVKADTLQAVTVIASAYTPGSGNIW